MAANDSNGCAKVSGYLEKKSKLRLVSSWKKYWFVLEGRLLLYYRSKAEYEAIRPCKGSITLGPACSLKPVLATSCVFQIETRTNTTTLRADGRYEQDKWIEAIQAAIKQTSSSPNKMCHFRYSADNLVPAPTSDTKKRKAVLERQNTLPDRTLTQALAANESNQLVERLKKLGAQSYGGSLQSITKAAPKGSPKLPKNENLKRLLKNTDVVEDHTYAQVGKVKTLSDSSIVVENSEYQSADVAVNKEYVVENETYETVQVPASERMEENAIYYSSEEINSESNNNVYSSKTSLLGSKEETDVALRRTIDHIYSEIILKRSEYCTINDFGISIDAGKAMQIYEEIASSPELPPRLQKTSDEQNKSRERIKHLATAVKENRKDGTRRRSFVLNMFKRKKGASKEEKPIPSPPLANLPPPEIPDETKEKILMELKRLLNLRKEAIKDKIREARNNRTEDSTEEPNSSTETDGSLDTNYTDTIISAETPIVPIKHKLKPTETLTDTPLNIPRPKLIIKKQLQLKIPTSDYDSSEKVKTIDEILNDLDREKQSKQPAPSSKVKSLVGKFSEADVEIRVRSCENCLYRYSDDLNDLLSELSKVTIAPVLRKCGATTSLVATALTDDEWKALIPIRTRRFSEPDYDIPRPHSSLTTLPIENKENAMEPTRFFGPLLIDDDDETSNGTATERSFSFAPDSLEVDHLYASSNNNNNTITSIEEDRSVFSYTSHTYVKEMASLEENKRTSDEEDIYSRPRSLYEHQQHQRAAKEGAEFQDSLEAAETVLASTTF